MLQKTKGQVLIKNKQMNKCSFEKDQINILKKEIHSH